MRTSAYRGCTSLQSGSRQCRLETSWVGVMSLRPEQGMAQPGEATAATCCLGPWGNVSRASMTGKRAEESLCFSTCLDGCLAYKRNQCLNLLLCCVHSTSGSLCLPEEVNPRRWPSPAESLSPRCPRCPRPLPPLHRCPCPSPGPGASPPFPRGSVLVTPVSAIRCCHLRKK